MDGENADEARGGDEAGEGEDLGVIGGEREARGEGEDQLHLLHPPVFVHLHVELSI